VIFFKKTEISRYFLASASQLVAETTGVHHLTWQNKTFDFEIIMDPHAMITNSANRSCVSFAQFPSMVMPSRSAEQCHSQDSTIDIVPGVLPDALVIPTASSLAPSSSSFPCP
jgi:hypothetical protein